MSGGKSSYVRGVYSTDDIAMRIANPEKSNQITADPRIVGNRGQADLRTTRD